MANKKFNINVVANAGKKKKKQNAKSSMAGVVAAAVAAAVKPKAKSGKRSKAQPSRRNTSQLDTGQYRSALTNPFSNRALGARVPDEFAVPTATYHMKSRFTLSTTAGGGNCSFMFSGQPFHTFYAGGSSSTVEFTTAALANYTANKNLYFAATELALAEKFTSYRVVSSGIKIHGLQPALVATGRLIMARVPMNTQLPGPNVLMNVPFTSNAEVLRSMTGIGLDSNNEIPVNILELPDSEEYSMQQLAESEILSINRPMSSDVYRMHSTIATPFVNATQAFGVGLSSGTSFADTSSYTETLDTVLCGGQSALLVRCEGCPATNGPILDIEFIIHIEGVPVVTNDAVAAFVPATCQVNSFGNTAQQIIEMARSLPLARMVDVGLQAYGSYRGGMMGARRNVARLGNGRY